MGPGMEKEKKVYKLVLTGGLHYFFGVSYFFRHHHVFFIDMSFNLENCFLNIYFNLHTDLQVFDHFLFILC